MNSIVITVFNQLLSNQSCFVCLFLLHAVITPVTAIGAERGVCPEPNWKMARDSVSYRDFATKCETSLIKSPNAAGYALLGYLHRNGYGYPRDILKARSAYSSALSIDGCNKNAICGIKSLADYSLVAECEVRCDDEILNSMTSKTAEERARDIMADLLRQDGGTRLAAKELEMLFEEVIEAEKASNSRNYEDLCLSHFKRAIASVALGKQTTRAIDRRQKLINYHQSKVDKGENTRSQADLSILRPAQILSIEESRVFEEKYHQSILAASNCPQDTMKRAFKRFSEEITNVKTTKLEEAAFKDLMIEVKEVRKNGSVNTQIYRNLTKAN